MNNARIFREYRPGDRKKYFRGKGLAGDAYVEEVADMRARRCAAVAKLQAMLGFGTGSVMGPKCYIEFHHVKTERFGQRLHELRARGEVIICHTANGALCFGPLWARVRLGGVTIEILAHECASSAV